MSVIVELTIPSDAFELGQILRVEAPARVTLETLVPLGGRPTPFIRLENDAREAFERSVREHPSVRAIQPVSTNDDETLYALEWDPSEESLFDRLTDMDVALLRATGTADSWELELRFPTHKTLSEFQEYYVDRGTQVTILRIYNPTKPDAGPWFGLTTPQRETLTHAVETGYYSLPREVSTKDLAAEFDISDQAVTERLRRGITTLVTNTLLTAETEQ
jgi:predicted DNA binding protein